jgi:hypothetical protein
LMMALVILEIRGAQCVDVAVCESHDLAPL